MRKDDALLLDILQAARQIREYLSGVTREQFLGRTMVQDAVIRQLLVVGEAAGDVSESCKAGIPQADWPGLVGLRNILVHQYFQIKIDRVWEIATTEIIPLVEMLEAIIPPEGPA